METYFETRTSWEGSRLIICLENTTKITVRKLLRLQKQLLKSRSSGLLMHLIHRVKLLSRSLTILESSDRSSFHYGVPPQVHSHFLLFHPAL